MLKIFIALSTLNRKKITTLCLENLSEIVSNDKNSDLFIYDDGSTTYDENFLRNFSQNVLRFRITGGIERSRARSMRDFEYIYNEFDLFYMTDNDTIHDPEFLNILRSIYESSSEKIENKLPIGLFNSVFHNDPQNIIHENEVISIRKTCPGVSQCYDRPMVSKIIKFLNKNPVYETLYGFDYHWPASLNIPFLQTKTSYLEHFAREKTEKGIHSPFNSDDPVKDLERDRALNPTKYLKKIREKTIKKIFTN